MKYVIVTAASVEGLEIEVNRYINGGWKPLGGPVSCLTAVYKNSYLAQAMTKEGD
jgi:hypothetical protein